MKYENIKKVNLSLEQIRLAMGYSSVNSLRHSSASKRVLGGIDKIIGMVIDNLKELKG